MNKIIAMTLKKILKDYINKLKEKEIELSNYINLQNDRHTKVKLTKYLEQLIFRTEDLSKFHMDMRRGGINCTHILEHILITELPMGDHMLLKALQNN